MKYKNKKMMCEECLSEFDFEIGDLWGEKEDGEYKIFVTCPACGSEVEVYDVEDYGIWPEEVVHGMEPEDEDESEDW